MGVLLKKFAKTKLTQPKKETLYVTQPEGFSRDNKTQNCWEYRECYHEFQGPDKG